MSSFSFFTMQLHTHVQCTKLYQQSSAFAGARYNDIPMHKQVGFATWKEISWWVQLTVNRTKAWPPIWTGELITNSSPLVALRTRELQSSPEYPGLRNMTLATTYQPDVVHSSLLIYRLAAQPCLVAHALEFITSSLSLSNNAHYSVDSPA